ncbi:MAG TPA: ABC transporter permease [Puia sp.]|nr:ABC transporter permease [Puia sp.]
MQVTILKNIFRTLWKDKAYSFLNLTGLAIALCACFLIYLYDSYELSYDSYHVNAHRIYRLVLQNEQPEGTSFGSSSIAMGPLLKENYPEVEQVVDITPRPFMVSNQKGTSVLENNVLLASPNFFSAFSYQFLKGDPATALSRPLSIVLSETGARKYFGSADPIGQPLRLNGEDVATVTGVIRDMPDNSHFRSDILLSAVRPQDTSAVNVDSAYTNLWNAYNGETYLMFSKGYDPKSFQPKLKDFMNKNANKLINEHQSHFSLLLEPLRSIYLHGKYKFEESGNINNIYIFSAIAVFILIIACANFVNLTTARAFKRAKETSIRKIAGASRTQLIRLFWAESTLLSLGAFLIACGMCAALIPELDQICEKPISSGLFEQASNIGILFLLSLGLGLAAGIYPAIMLSSFDPVTALTGRFTSTRNGILLRKTLVVLQFTISIVLIVGTLVVYSQLTYMREQPLGFKKDQMFVIDFNRDTVVQNHITAFKQEMKSIPGVLSASASSGIPNSGFEPVDYEIQNYRGTMQAGDMALYMIDDDFLNNFQINLVAGKAFSKNLSGNYLLMNETAAKKLGYPSPADVLNKPFKGEGGHGTVLGVVRDFHFRSLQEQIQPQIFLKFNRAFRYLTLSISARNMPSTIEGIRSKWHQLAPTTPLNYFFLDEAIDREYRSEAAFGKLSLFSGLFAILIASLGLLGLTLFNCMQRRKEIAVRKVMGAEVPGILVMLTKDVVYLILIAFVIGSPIAWLGMNRWLETFAYRISVPWWTFLLAVGIALTIAILAVGVQTIRAAIANPVTNLRVE